MKLVALCALLLSPLCGQPFARYGIERAVSPISIDGKLDDAAWKRAKPMSAWHFPWHKEGEKEPTESKMLWDDQFLYVSYLIHDRHISAYEKKRHGPVSKDDCVEIFIAPNAAKVRNYYTFEINTIGTMLNRCKADWWTGPPTWEPEGVQYRTSHQGLEKKEESPEDRYWTVEMAIPWSNFVKDAPNTPPRPGDEWRLNLNRTGGITNKQWSSWSPIGTPTPVFHTPEAFGYVRFVGSH
jgi:hypothetical protein